MLLTIFAEIFCLTRDIAVALFDLIGGSRRRHYRHTLVIRAPREAVWRAINAETTDFAGIIPTTAVTERIPGTDHYRTILKTDEHQQVMTWRQTLRREGAALHCDILADGTDAALIRGVDDRIGYQLTDAPGGARLTVFREVTPHGMMDAIGAPFGVRSGARLYKRMVEKDAGVRPTVLERLTGFGVVLSLLAFASFCYLMDFELAVVLAVVILLHELGHAFAMRLVGMEVKGIYLVPFFALCGRPHKANYVASHDMWRARGYGFCGARKRTSYATYLCVDDRSPSLRLRIEHARRTVQGANRYRSLSDWALHGISRAISQEGARRRLFSGNRGAHRLGVANRS